MFVAIILAVSLVVLTFLFHYIILRWLSGGMARIAMTASVRVFIIVLMTLGAHLVEVVLYAVAYALGDGVLGLGSFGGRMIAEPLDYLYFSIVSLGLAMSSP